MRKQYNANIIVVLCHIQIDINPSFYYITLLYYY
jgi:hypothetical protein